MTDPFAPLELTPEIADGIRQMRWRIANQEIPVPASKLDESINIATWNIRHLGRGRSDAALFYLAEALNMFDLVAITEVKSDITDLSRIVRLLGPYWRIVFSDFIADSGGNWERIAYLYDRRAVVFTGLAGEANPERRKHGDGEDPARRDPRRDEYLSEISWWRSPYMVSFRAGRFDFILLTAHIRWSSHEDNREAPIRMLANWLHERRAHHDAFDKDIVLLGDFNTPSPTHRLFEVLTSRGLEMPAVLERIPGANLERTKHYDQILHYPKLAAPMTYGGVLDVYQGDVDGLFPQAHGDVEVFKREISDHLPLWVQLDVDVEDARLSQLIGRSWT